MEAPGSVVGTDRRAAYLVGLLARALATQIDELARPGTAPPDGWWFTEPRRAGTAGGPR